MPAEFLSDQERERYQSIPSNLSQEDLSRYCFLSNTDRQLISGMRRDHNRLGFALQLAVLRLMNHLPQEWYRKVPDNLVNYVARQLDINDPAILINYGNREKTVSEHLYTILLYLKRRRWQPLIDTIPLEKWLLERALEHDNEHVLLSLACDWLREELILRPAIIELERLVVSMADLVHQETYKRLSTLLRNPFKENLDNLLVVDKVFKTTPHNWLSKPPVSPTANQIKLMLHKRQYLTQLDIEKWDTSSLHPNRRKRLAVLARSKTNQALIRMSDTKRYPMLVAFCLEAYITLTDYIIKLFDEYWEDISGQSVRELTEYQLKQVKSRDGALMTLGKAAEPIVDEINIPAAELRARIYASVSRSELIEAIDIMQMLTRQGPRTFHYFLISRYRVIKSFSASFLDALTFEHAFSGDDFEQALQLIGDWQTGRKRKNPEELPMKFMLPSWKSFVEPVKGEIDRPAYELSVLARLRDRLRSGDVYVNHSRKYASPDTYLIPEANWKAHRTELLTYLGYKDATPYRLEEQISELESHLPLMEQILADGGDIRLDDDGELVVTPLKADDIPESVKALRAAVDKLLPRVELTDLLVEVDNWTGFSSELTGLENEPRSKDHQALLYAALLAGACNIPLTEMAQSAGLDYQALWWVSTNYIREETLKRATVRLVNYQHELWLSSYWGSGMLSSSDGQRFPVSGKIRNAQSIPRYYGYGKGYTLITHTSDQYAQYGSRSIPSTIRDATYVLDEILGNETDLEIIEHTTDTGGYTDIIFALFDLLWLLFSPRLRDLANQSLCRIKGMDLKYPSLKFTSNFRPEYVRARWDDLLRVAATLKSGWVTSSLLISKLQGYPRQHHLTALLQEYGKLVKTTFILRYLQSQPLRRRIHAQLNKGEQLHALRAWLWFGGDGHLRKKQEDAQQETAGCLNVLTNLVVVWNTVYTQEVLKKHQADGHMVDENDFEHLSPARFAHINRLGRYTFQKVEQFEDNGLRPLRT
jgi:TnpA family transposase